MTGPGFDVGEWRVEGCLKVTGKALYAADRRAPGALWAAFTTSPLPHAHIRSIDVSGAVAMRGVRAVLTGHDVGRSRFGRYLLDRPVLAWDRVRFVGDRVAAVAADGREIAEAAAELIEVEYEPLPTILTTADALDASAAILHPDREVYRVMSGAQPRVPHLNLQNRQVVTKGDPDIERALAGAAHVFEHSFSTPKQHHGYIEPHATLLWIESDGTVNVVSTNKAPYALRAQLAATIGLPAEMINVDSGYIGGDFGGKGYSIDEFACYYLARATGRPIRAQMRYADELTACNTRHAADLRLRTGVDADGRLVAHHAVVTFDGGAYASAKPTPALTPHGGVMSLSAYRVPTTRIEVSTVYTNTVPAGHMRSPGEVQALFAGESHIDMIARSLEIDPLELRRRNALRDGDRGPANELFHRPRAVEVLDALAEHSTSTPAPPGCVRGRGHALSRGPIGGGKSTVTLSATADGAVELVVGVPDQGAGAHTMLQRVAATVLSLPVGHVRVTRSTTSDGGFDSGAGASRTTRIAGEATRKGATALKSLLEEAACRVLGWPEGTATLVDGRFRRVGDHDVDDLHDVDVTDVVGRLPAEQLPRAVGVHEAQHGTNEPEPCSFVGTSVEVHVDVGTGQVTIADVLLVADVGTVINPVAHQGQIDGGVAFGIGAALLEELLVEDGYIATAHLGDYKLPTSRDIPPLRTVLIATQDGPGPFGAKAIGELGNVGVAPAVANAVRDAVGVNITTLPVTAERVHSAMADVATNHAPTLVSTVQPRRP